jgi:hypothetical protein
MAKKEMKNVIKKISLYKILELEVEVELNNNISNYKNLLKNFFANILIS